MTKTKVLITGGVGYVGGAVTSYLLQRDDVEVRVYDNLLYEDAYRKEVDFVYGDILDFEQLKPHLEWADCVVWLAAIVGDGACKLDEVLTLQVNQESVKWLTENFKGKIIFTSTCSVYGAQNDINLTEESGIEPLSLYAYTKYKAENYLKNSNALILRLGTLFGISDTYSRIRMDLVVNTMSVRAHATGKISVFGGGQYRPLLHVRDVGKVIADHITTASKGVYNLACENIKIVDLAHRIKKFYPEVVVEITKMPFEDTRNYIVITDKAKRDLNFNPEFSIDFGIQQLKELLTQNRIKDLNAVRYSNQLFLKDYFVKKPSNKKWKNLLS